MIVLAIDGSLRASSIAVFDNEILLGSLHVSDDKLHSRTLFQMIDDLLKRLNKSINDVELIAVPRGPGSFTGLRITASIAKSLAQALDIKLVAVDTLAALAYTKRQYQSYKICPIIDARVDRVYSALYSIIDDDINILMDQKLFTIDDLIDSLNDIDGDILFLGDGFTSYEDVIKKKLKRNYICLDIGNTGEAIGMLGIKNYNNGYIDDCFSFLPLYLQVSQAERNLHSKMLDI